VGSRVIPDLANTYAAQGTRPSVGHDEKRLRELMVRYQQGDKEAVEALVKALSPTVTRYCGASWISQDELEDLVQECWLRVHRARHTYLPSEPLLPWFFAVVRHTRLDAFRQRHRRSAREVLTREVPDIAVENAAGADIMQLVSRLPDGQRDVILMLKVVGMSLEEVARATSSSVGGIKQKAHRAYEALREMLTAGDGSRGR
jgi:RNA polymerase sigma-70 factor (ECF subfamily)